MLIERAHVTKWEGHRLSDLIIMIPNGAYLGADARQRAITMDKLKRSGLKPGVFDYLLPVPSKTLQSPGLWLEMKRTQGGVTSPEQVKFMGRMTQLGWMAAVCNGYENAWRAIMTYLSQCAI